METATVMQTEEVRAHLRTMWGRVAGGWAEHAAFVDTRAAAMTERLLELARPERGARVLELAAGAGGVGLVAAGRVGPEGEVVISDVAPEMTGIASRRAGALGLGNVRTRVLDLEQIDEPDEAYDVVLCREGLMLVPDPDRAAREILRVLRPGGRVALTVWGPREQNPWLGIVFDTVSAETGAQLPPPGFPGPFSLEDRDRLAGVLAGAGLAEVEVEELPTPYRVGSVEEWWRRTAALAGPLSQRLAALPDPARQALLVRARAAVGAYETPTLLELPGLALVASAVRPEAAATAR
jgi:SAM-dependent methyltransferase